MGYYSDAGLLPIYSTADQSNVSNFVSDLALKLKVVTLNESSLSDIKKYGRLYGTKSVFNEISWLNPISDIRQNKKMVCPSRPSFSCKPEYWAELLLLKLEDYFVRNLHENETYWIMHSSGGDSRILSGVLAKLRDEGRLKGKIKFVLWYPEADQARKILFHLGWNPEDLFTPGDEKGVIPNHKHYWNETNFYSFDDCGILTNGEIQPFGMSQSNFWKPYYESVKNINAVMAMIGDMVMGGKWWIKWARKYFFKGRIPNYSLNYKWNILINTSTRWNGLGVLGYKCNFKSLMAPTMELDFVNTGLSIPFCARSADNVRITMQEKLKPGLSGFANLHESWYMKSEGLSEKVFKDYYNSKFFKKYRIDHSSSFEIKYPTFLSLASLYDHLIENGVEIKV